MPVLIKGQSFYYTQEALRKAGVKMSTWRKWVRENTIKDVKLRNRQGWRLFTEKDIQKIKDFDDIITTQ